MSQDVSVVTNAVIDYVTWSAELATEYMQLGKHTRANFVFLQTFRVVVDTEREVSPSARVELHLRYSCFLAESGNLVKRSAHSS